MKKKKIVNNLFLFIPLFILLTLSLVNMYMAGTTLSLYKNYCLKQAIWFLLGFIVLFIITILKPKLLFKYSKYFYYFNVLLLILVLFFGKTVNGSQAWFHFGFISFQPSELMKFTLTLYLCEILSKMPKNGFKSELKFILKALFYTLIPSLFVFLEPDTGAIIIYFLIMLGIIFAYKINFKWYLVLAIVLIIFLGLFGYFYYFNKDILINIMGTSFFYRVDRILTFVNNDSYQLNRALISIGSSGFFSSNNYVYIPEAPTDFIIAFSISKLGLWNFFVILLSFLIIDIYFIIKFFKFKNLKLKMFVAAFLLMFIFAQIQNIGMNLGLLPIIGLPLPFLSYGGTNIIVYFMFLSVLINIKDV